MSKKVETPWDDVQLDELDEAASSFFGTMPETIALRIFTYMSDSKNQKKGAKGYAYEATDSLSPVITLVAYKKLKNMFVPKMVTEDEWKDMWQLRYDQFPYLEAESFLSLLQSAGIAPDEVEKAEESIL